MGSTPRISDSVGLGVAQYFAFQNKFSGNADAAGPKTTLGELLP